MTMQHVILPRFAASKETLDAYHITGKPILYGKILEWWTHMKVTGKTNRAWCNRGEILVNYLVLLYYYLT